MLPVLTAVVLVRRQDELGQIAGALGTADPRWVALGIVVEAATLLATGLTYRLLLRRLGHRLPCLTLVSVHLQRAAVGAVSPLSGPTSVYIFVRLLDRFRVPIQDGLLTIALRSAAGQGALVLTLLVALALHGAVPALLAAGGLIAAATLVVTRLRRRPALLGRSWRFCRRRLPRGAARWIGEFRTRLGRHRLTPRDLAWPLALAVGTRAGAVALLFASMRALGVEASPATAVAIYLAAVLAQAAVPVFGGAGVVEGATAVALRQAGVPWDLAVGVTLLWRLIDFWLPLGIGLVAHAATLLHPAMARVAGTLAAGRAGAPADLGWQPVPVASARPAPATGAGTWSWIELSEGSGTGSHRSRYMD